MKKRSLQWDDLKTLAAVHRGGSHSAAARELGLTHATIGRRLRDLEDAVGTALFERSESGLQLSEVGREVLASAASMEDCANRLERQLLGQRERVSGKVRVTCTEGFGTYLLPAHLPSLFRRHPGLSLELLVDARRLSLARRHADIALRVARPEEPDLVARHVADISHRLYCRADQAEAMRALLKGSGEVPLCRVDSSLAALPESVWLLEHLPAARTVLSANSVLSLAEACAAGAGVALLSCFTGNRLGLVALDTPNPPVRQVWLAYPAEYRDVPRFRAVADWLVEVFATEAPALRGEVY